MADSENTRNPSEGKPAWTPGPWVMIRLVDGDEDIFTVGHRRGGIARMLLHSEKQKAEAVANARLIASAPELYEALTACLNYIENTECELGIKLSCGDKARSALSRAHGGEK